MQFNRSVLENRETWMEYVSQCAKESIAYGSAFLETENTKALYETIVNTSSLKSAINAYECADFRIERPFICALFSLFAQMYIGGAKIERFSGDMLAFEKQYRAVHKLALEQLSLFRSSAHSYDDLKDWLIDREKNSALPQWSVEPIYRQAVTIELGGTQGYFMIPQANFIGIGIHGENIRTDLYIWNVNSDFRLVIECDGYDYHCDKPTFTKDRQRIRALKYQGIDVLSFSGSEIYNDPNASAGEIFKYLLKNDQQIKLPNHNT